MATSRRKSPGFTSSKEEEAVRELLEENARELFETISHAEDEVETKSRMVTPFVEQEITPTEDPGPRFVGEPPAPLPEESVAPLLQPPPRRHPRNIPKFSNFK